MKAALGRCNSFANLCFVIVSEARLRPLLNGGGALAHLHLKGHKNGAFFLTLKIGQI